MSVAAPRDVARMRTEDFVYALPHDRIAQEPPAHRDASRLLHVAPDGTLHDRRFAELPGLMRPGDLLVANDTRVRKARLRGRVDDGSTVELLVLERVTDGIHRCLVQPAKRVRPGACVVVSDALSATCLGLAEEHPGARDMAFTARAGGDVEAAIDDCGTAPVPPYIRKELADAGRYQTLYARGAPESAAAPTAGLHFTPSVLDALRRRGVGWTTVRLNVGLATFAPIRTASIDDHRMHEEAYQLPSDAAAAVMAARTAGGRVIAVGTTVVRVLESCASSDGTVRPRSGRTRLYIKPGHEFRVVDGLLTNFHQPRSSLLVLLAAFIGTDGWRAAYGHALSNRYRFLSFGDCMLCWHAGA